jgi:hypothetical protein
MGERLKRVVRVLGLVALGLVELLVGAYAALALAFHPGIGSALLRQLLGGAFALLLVVALVALCLRAWRWWAQAALAVAFVLFLASWSRIEPSNDRDWIPEVARAPWAEVTADAITFHDVRDFDYRSETDFDARWYDRTYRLDRLQGVDLWSVYWMGPAIAHLFVSFDFGDDGKVAISIEARKSQGEGYSSVLGFFRHYELVFIVADERDVVRVRTNYRKDPPEDVYRYSVTGDREMMRRFLLSYVERINAVHDHPEFYSTLTTNCTTTIWQLAEVNPGRVPLSWKVLVSGYAAEYLYGQGRLDSSLPFAELTRRGHVNARAQAADQAADFSERIRAPDPAP